MDDTPKPTIGDLIASKLSAWGAKAESIQSIKLGRGIVGKLTVVAVAAILAVAGMSAKLSAADAMIAIWLVFAIAMAVLVAVITIAFKQPDLALLEGAELVMWKQAQLSAKNAPPERDLIAPPIPDPAPKANLEDGGAE